MICDVICSLLVLIGKLAFFKKQLQEVIISLKGITGDSPNNSNKVTVFMLLRVFFE